MNNPLNLNQTPKNIAEYAKLMFKNYGYVIRTQEECNLLAVILIENMLSVVPQFVTNNIIDGGGILDNPEYLTLSEVLEILNKEIKS